MKTPWLIQRCELGSGKLRYDYMGSSEFEFGDQAKSLKRIFEKGMVGGTATISLQGKEVTVYMVAGTGFSFADYQQYLQQLVEHKLRLQEHSGFDNMVKVQLGIRINGSGYIPTYNVWFDIQNDVLWTLSEDNLQALVSVLRGVE
jgi:hypothetical protein